MHEATERTTAPLRPGDSNHNGHTRPGRKLRSLLVGSKLDGNHTLSGLLSRISCVGEVVGAAGPREALSLVRGAPCQVILLDMAEHSIESLRALAEGVPGVPVIAVLPHEGQLAIDALRAGAEECLAWDDLDASLLERAILHSIERKAAENSLRVSEARFRALFEQSPNPICIHRPDGLSIDVNQAVLDGFRMTREQAVRYNVLQDSALLSQPGVAEAIGGTFEGEATTLPHLLFSSDAHGWTDEPLARRLAGTGYPIKDSTGTVQEVVLIWDDVTAQEEAERKLRDQEEQYRAIFEATTDGLVIGDMNRRTVAVNPTFAAMHGYTAEEMIGMDPREYIHPDSHPAFADFYSTVTAGKSFKGQAVDVRKDGSTFHVEVTGTMLTYRGEPHVLGIIRDITERVRAEAQLRLKEEQYRAVFEATTDGLVISDLISGSVVEVNPAFAAMHGYTREEMVGLHPSAFVHPDDYPVQAGFMERARRGERAYARGRDVRKDGTEFFIEVHGVPFTHNHQPHVLAIMRDVTERVMQEEQVRLKEEQYRAIFEATSDGLVISDLEGNVLEVNPAFAEMGGYTREELVGMDPRVWIHPNSHASLEEYLKKVRAGEHYRGEGMQVRKDGTVFHAEVHEAPFMYNGKRHTLAIIRDITERVMHRELLEQRVEERTRELTTLLEVSSNVASMLELEPLLGRILEQLRPVAYYDRASITVDKGPAADPVVLSAWGSPTSEPLPIHVPVDVQELGPLSDRLEHGEAIIIPDIHSGTPEAEIVLRTVERSISRLDSEAAEHLRAAVAREHSLLIAPLNLKGTVIGGLLLRHNQPDYYTEQHAELARAIANQAAVALENARLYEQALENARKTAALAQVASRVAFGGSLSSTLSALCGHIVGVSGSLASAVMLRDADTGRSNVVGAHGLPQEYIETLNSMLAQGVRFRTEEAFEQQRPVVMEEVRNLLLGSEACAPLHPFMHAVPWDTIVALPIVSRDTPVGILLSYHPPAARVGEAELTFHSMIADQAAVAVENAHLLAEADDKARLEERQRLARELHDSVTQALFSTNLIARSLEVMLQREGTHSEAVMEKMADLRQLTSGAMAEMRALIFELRPGALEEEGLLEALRKHVAAIAGREVLNVSVAVTGEGDLPRLKPAAEEALYRIAQEALHNVVKHARASKVEVSLGTEGSSLVLRVKDDGRGFDPSGVPAGHMGLGTMGQRAQALHAGYRIATAPGHGTCIEVTVPLAEWQLAADKET